MNTTTPDNISAPRERRLLIALAGWLACLALPTLAAAAAAPSTDVLARSGSSPDRPSIVRAPQEAAPDKDAAPERGGGTAPARFPDEFRSFDGTGNHQRFDWGAAGTAFLRLLPADYGDGLDAPAGIGRASARAISSICSAQEDGVPNAAGVSDMVWQWGQFLDHDIDLTPTVEPAEPFDIAVPLGDPWFDPFATGAVTIPLDRSYYEHEDGVREQINFITAFIDASNVYGSDAERAAALRTLDGSGRLQTSAGDLLPYNEPGLPNAPVDTAEYFLAGDFRANEQVGLTAMHTLFVREHNHWAEVIAGANPELDGDQVYQYARAIVAGEMQAITYREFLPVLLGRDALRPYRGYRPDVNPGISNAFATAAYRFGHSMLSTELQRLDEDGAEIAAGHLPLQSAFFTPDEIADHGIEPLLRGLLTQRAQEIDLLLVDDVRNFLFGPPGSGGFDLASLNIQRGRDHGLPSLNDARRALGIRPARAFRDVNPDPKVSAALAAAYESVEDIDLWVGGLAEQHVQGGLVGPTVRFILADQFERLRDGDRFFYRSYLPRTAVQVVESQTLATIIERNTDGAVEVRGNPFLSGGRPPRR